MLLFHEATASDYTLTGNKPIDKLSVITSSDSFDIHSLLSNCFYYSASDFNGLDGLLEEVKDAQYWIELTKGESVLSIDSSDSNIIKLVLNEHDLFQNNYITRYLKFKQQRPNKPSKDTSTFYSAFANYSKSANETPKYDKDLRILIELIFPNASLRVSSNKAIPSLGQFRQIHNLASGPIDPQADLSPLTTKNVEEPHDYYEYFSLLHMNKAPSSEVNDYVRVTSMYEVPINDSDGPFNGSLTLTFANQLDPRTISLILTESSVVSVLYDRDGKNTLILKLASKIYVWESKT